MKILEQELVVRFHCEYDKEETKLLKSIGFLPPTATPRARLWNTQDEITATEELLERIRRSS
jgi:hypothetical protein